MLADTHSGHDVTLVTERDSLPVYLGGPDSTCLPFLVHTFTYPAPNLAGRQLTA